MRARVHAGRVRVCVIFQEFDGEVLDMIRASVCATAIHSEVDSTVHHPTEVRVSNNGERVCMSNMPHAQS